MITDNEIKEALQPYNLTPDQLTPAELESLKNEIKARKEGATILDSVLDNPELYYRHLKKKTKHYG